MDMLTTLLPYRNDAFRFFYENAGFSVAPSETERIGRTRSARELAQAELWAVTRSGLTFEWEEDPDADLECDCGNDHGSAYGCVVRRGDEREVVASLWGIQFADHAGPRAAPYARVVEAELALEVLHDVREIALVEAFNPELRALLAYAS